MASIESIKKALIPLIEKTAEAEPGDLEGDKKVARLVLASLRESFTDHSEHQIAQISYTIGLMAATMAELPVRHLAETLDNSAVGYAMASASLLGLLDISETPGGGSEPIDLYGAYL